MKTREVMGGIVLAGGWGALLFAAAIYLLYWRVDNEPGAKDFPALLWMAISLGSLGGLAFVGGQVYLLMKKAWLALGVAWVGVVALSVGAVSLAPILLLLMV